MAPLNVSKCLSISSFLPLQLNTWDYFQIYIDNQTDQMNPMLSYWDLMAPGHYGSGWIYGSLRVLMDPQMFCWTLGDSDRFLWILRFPNSSWWLLKLLWRLFMDLSVSWRVIMGPDGTLWIITVRIVPVFMVYNVSDGYLLVYGSFIVLMVPYRSF